MHILRQTSLFLPLPNQSYRQVCGVPIYDLDRLPTVTKKRKRDDLRGKAKSDASQDKTKQNYSEIFLNRSAIFYSNLTKTLAESSGLSAARKLRISNEGAKGSFIPRRSEPCLANLPTSESA